MPGIINRNLLEAPKKDETNPLLDYMRTQNMLNTAPILEQDARKAFSQTLSQALLGFIPGSGIAGAMGYTPSYGDNYFIPNGAEKGPSVKDNLLSGDYGLAALQAVGIIPDLSYVTALGAMAPKTAQRGMAQFWPSSSAAIDDLKKVGAHAQGSGYYILPNGKRVRVSDHHPINDRSAADANIINGHFLERAPEHEAQGSTVWTNDARDLSALLADAPRNDLPERLGQRFNSRSPTETNPITSNPYKIKDYPVDYTGLTDEQLTRETYDMLHRNAPRNNAIHAITEMFNRDLLPNGVPGTTMADFRLRLSENLRQITDRLDGISDKRYSYFKAKPGYEDIASSLLQQQGDMRQLLAGIYDTVE